LVIPFLLFVTMLRHSKGAWFVAVFFAALGLISAPGYMEDSRAFAIWGLVISAIDLGILLSPQARNWVNQPTERKWRYPPKEKDGFMVRRCRNCGDTFPTADRYPRCQSCGSTDVDLATEPLL
jgi:hypothetical protein